jgi:hypothetical protein
VILSLAERSLEEERQLAGSCLMVAPFFPVVFFGKGGVSVVEENVMNEGADFGGGGDCPDNTALVVEYPIYGVL